MAEQAITGLFGGMAEGLQARQENDRQDRLVALAEEKQRALEDNNTKAAAVQRIDQTIQHIDNIFKSVAAAGKDPQAVIPLVKPLADSAKGFAAAAGIDPAMIDHTIGAFAARPPAEDDTAHSIVKVAGGIGEPEKVFRLEKKSGTLTPIDLATGQPAGQPPLAASDVISPVQAQRANPPGTPGVPAPVSVQQPAQAAPAAIPPEAALPPNAAPTESISSRFIEPAPPSPPENPNINLSAIGHLPDKTQQLIKGVADGTIDPIKAFSLRKGPDGMSERASMLQLVKAYDPSFDTANAPARAATLKAFKSGVEARKVSALGTVIGHVTELHKDGLALDNWKSDTWGPATKTFNSLRLWVESNKQSPLVRKFELDADAVSNELENAFRGNNTAISGIMEWRKSLSPAMSSDEIAATTQKLGSLLRARLSELNEQYDRGMGHNRDQTISMKLAATRDLLDKMSAGTLFSDRTIPGTPAATSNPTVDALKQKYGL